MEDVTRRSLVLGAGAAVAAAEAIQKAQARTEPFGPTDPFDLVVRGGEVVDPSQNLRGKRDIGHCSNRTGNPRDARHPDTRRF
jgi:dihydroorotase